MENGQVDKVYTSGSEYTVQKCVIFIPQVTRVNVTVNSGEGKFSDNSTQKEMFVNAEYKVDIGETPKSNLENKKFDKWAASGGQNVKIEGNTIYTERDAVVTATYVDKPTTETE